MGQWKHKTVGEGKARPWDFKPNCNWQARCDTWVSLSRKIQGEPGYVGKQVEACSRTYTDLGSEVYVEHERR